MNGQALNDTMPEPDLRAQARAHFQRARQATEAGDLDRAIDAYLEGLRLTPDEVSEGHIELRVLALQRQERNGVPPSAEEAQQRLSAGDGPLDQMLNAEYLLAKDPEHLAYGEAVLRAAVAGGYGEAAKWMADLMFLANNKARKPSANLYILLEEAYAAIGQYDRAAAACQRALRLKPKDSKLLGDLREIRAKLLSTGRPTPARTVSQAPTSGRTRPQRTRVKEENPVAPAQDTKENKIEAVMTESAGMQDLAEAQPFFEMARKAAETKQYDYAIDMYLDGLKRAPEAIEEGHLPLCELGLHRRGKGGKKPSMVEKVKRMRGKTPLEHMLNAEYLFVKDPDNLSYAEAMLRAAVDGGFNKTAHWIANLIFQTNNAVQKPSLHTYLLLKDCYSAMGQYDKAVAACQRASRMRPDDKALADEFKNLSAELTMSKGKYDMAGDFRQSILDQEAQARLYAQDRVIKTKDYRVEAVEEARKAYAREPDQPKSIFNLAQALADLDTDEGEDEAIQLLEDAYVGRNDFSFKQRAGKLRMKQVRRKLRQAKKTAGAQPQDAAAKQAVTELTTQLNSTELEHYRLSVENYPTDLTAKYEYALRLTRNKRYNEAIPLFQEAQKDPRHRISSMDKVGYCFFMKAWYTDAAEIFQRAIESYEIKDDATAKELRYNLARTYEEQGAKDNALELYRKIAQLDFGYKDVSARVDKLRAASEPSGSGAPGPDGE